MLTAREICDFVNEWVDELETIYGKFSFAERDMYTRHLAEFYMETWKNI